MTHSSSSGQWQYPTYNALGQRVEDYQGTASTSLKLYYPRDIFGDRTGIWDDHSSVGWVGWDVYWSEVAGQRLNMGGSSAYIDHSDAVGSTTMETDPAGGIQWDMTYYPWGQIWQQTGTRQTGVYAGLDWRVNDPLIPSATRELSPALGRWMTPDPGGRNVVKLDDPQTWNMYAYVGNNPTTLNDPGGLQSDCATGGGCSSNGDSFEEDSMHFSDGRYGLEETITDTPTGAQNQSWWSRTLSFFGLHQSSGSGDEPSSWTPDKPLPNDPKDLGPDWKKNPEHKDPNGEQYVNDETGEKLEWNKGRPGQPGNRRKDHWHYTPPGGKRGREHFGPGETVKKLIVVTGAGVAIHVIIETAPEWAPLLAIP